MIVLLTVAQPMIVRVKEAPRLLTPKLDRAPGSDDSRQALGLRLRVVPFKRQDPVYNYSNYRGGQLSGRHRVIVIPLYWITDA
jgi:hypothetical protein